MMGWEYSRSLLTSYVGNSDSAARRHRKQLFSETVRIKGTKEHTRASPDLHVAKKDYNNLTFLKLSVN